MTAPVLAWINEQALDRRHPLFADHRPARAVFVVDPDHFSAKCYALKRFVFIAECLREAGIEMVRGPYGEVVDSLMASGAFGRVVVPATPDPVLRDAIDTVAHRHPVTVVPDTPFVALDRRPDLKRFFRYWVLARSRAFEPTQAQV